MARAATELPAGQWPGLPCHPERSRLALSALVPAASVRSYIAGDEHDGQEKLSGRVTHAALASRAAAREITVSSGSQVFFSQNRTDVLLPDPRPEMAPFQSRYRGFRATCFRDRSARRKRLVKGLLEWRAFDRRHFDGFSGTLGATDGKRAGQKPHQRASLAKPSPTSRA